MRVSTNVSVKKENRLELSGFLGVDLSSSPLNVSNKRASYARNFINENGINRKRNGWKEVMRFVDKNGVALKINGIFNYTINAERISLVHAGNKIYRVKYNPETNLYQKEDLVSGNSLVNQNLIQNERSSAFVNSEKIWIICGDYLVFSKSEDKYSLKRVEDDEDTYIPTTTIGIVKDGEHAERRSLDNVNFLNRKRKNRLLGAEANSTWTVDSNSIDLGTKVEVEIKETKENNKKLTNSGEDKTKLFDDQGVECGAIDFILGKITLTIDTTPESADTSESDNITITFEKYEEGNAQKIYGCKIGVQFGAGSNADRLFLAGNPSFPNIDFHSEMDNLSYFPASNTTAFGTSATRIVAYSRLGDGTLAIIKEDSAKESTIYYRGVSTYQQDEVSNQIIFPIQSGSIGEGAISSFATNNLSGDNLFLSRNGVFGIVLSDNIATNERYARERSRYINETLCKHDLSQAVSVVYKGRYILAVDNLCYILDSRYKSTMKGDMTDTFNYECYVWDNMPVRVWDITDDTLSFGTEDGRICSFDEEYSDRTYQELTAGNITVDYEANKITINRALYEDLKAGHKFVFRNDLYGALASARCENGLIFIDEKDIDKFFFGQEICVDSIVGIGSVSTNTLYKINDISYTENYIELVDENGLDVNIDGIESFRICKGLKDVESYVVNIEQNEDLTTFKLSDSKDGEPVDLIIYNNVSINNANILGQIIFKDNVCAMWKTPVLDLGTNEYSKTLVGITIATSPDTNGAVTFGYETKKVNNELTARQVLNASSAKGYDYFSFDNINFNHFTFETAFASSYTKRVRERNFNYISFMFESIDDKPSAVNSLSVIYSICKKNRGVR